MATTCTTDIELVSNGRAVSVVKLKRPIETAVTTITTSEKKQKLATNSTTAAAKSMTAGVYVREVSQTRGSGASRPEVQQCVKLEKCWACSRLFLCQPKVCLEMSKQS